jgi:hypothetical protein
MVQPVFGWIPHEDRTSEQKEIHEAIVREMPSFQIVGDLPFESDRMFLWDIAKKLNGGKHLPCLYQQVGSCVGHGKANAEWYLQVCQIAVGGRNDRLVLPYEPYGYAQSRVCAGIRGGGDGSTGSGAAKAAMKYGVLSSELPNLPAFERGEKTITFSGSVDRSWGRAGAPENWITEGFKHLVKTTALVRSAEDVKKALQNLYPVTIASNWGGQMRPSVRDGVLLNRRVTSWAHQMSVIAWWKHPSLGDIFYILNSWSHTAHGEDPAGGPPGGFWVLASDMDYITRQGDSYAYSDVNGFPSRRPNFNIVA